MRRAILEAFRGTISDKVTTAKGFLEDIEDLENPDLGRQEKQNVIERMWRSWAYSLGWHNLALLQNLN